MRCRDEKAEIPNLWLGEGFFGGRRPSNMCGTVAPYLEEVRTAVREARRREALRPAETIEVAWADLAANVIHPLFYGGTAANLAAEYLQEIHHEELLETLERIKWYLWHGNVYEALYWADDLEWAVEETEVAYPKLKKLKRTLREFRVYTKQNGAFIPNYGERWRYGETISTAMAESTVNAVVGKRFCKKQQMQWTRRGAHLLLQTRTAVLNGELAARFRQWYPSFAVEEDRDEQRMAA